MSNRRRPLPERFRETFFLWGSWQTWKTTSLRDRFPNALRYEFLRSSNFTRFSHEPESLVLPALEFLRRLWAGEILPQVAP